MTGAAPRPHRRHLSPAGRRVAGLGGLGTLVACDAAVGDDGRAPGVDAPARLSSAVLLDPVPIESLAPRSGTPATAWEGATGRWADPLVSIALVVLAAGVLSLRWTARRGARTLPSEVCSVLGEMPLGGTHVARVVRFGPKTILLGVSGGACRTLAEIDDAALTDTLVAACRGAEGGAAKTLTWPALPRWCTVAQADRREATR